ncbi:hypothetical protein, partial [Streptomyces rhizosphaericola]|uniref:hypothetical protein n=1 Tax=Streptomyces rhizosphaericola TaxID=2564098 RepID=UPI0019D142A1
MNTGSADGFSAVPATTARPVVAATWRRDVQQRAHEAPGPPRGGQGFAPQPAAGTQPSAALRPSTVAA